MVQRMRNIVLQGDALSCLRELPEASVQCCVTSPPYWNLRDYKVEGQIGQEPTVKKFVERLVEVFREVHRVLRPDGTLWLNLGDSYATQKNDKIKPKDLCGAPWRVALALQDDGWWLRSDVIWHKTYGMPESVKDRPTRNHEYIFLLTKSEAYYYDSDSIKEPHKFNKWSNRKVEDAKVLDAQYEGVAGSTSLLRRGSDLNFHPEGGKNKRTVWTITPKPFPDAHFAVFPPELPETCIKAGTKPGDLVLDPFAGTGTTLQIAKDLRRDFIGIELNPKYVEMIHERITPSLELENQRQLADYAASLEDEPV